jgi:TM2 domain-containing membrane protein YozV
MRRAARWLLDRFQFGSGTGERLGASLVLSAVFFLVLLVIAASIGWPVKYGLAVGGIALVSALITSAVLVLGPADESLSAKRVELVNELDTAKVEGAELRAQVEAERLQQEEDDEVREVRKLNREAEREERRKRTCSYCGGKIVPWAAKCPHCHEYLDEDLARERNEANRPKSYSGGVAAVLSFFFAGLGQLYKGQVLGGLVWFIMVESIYALSLFTACCGVGLFLLPLAVLLHLVCIFDAAS